MYYVMHMNHTRTPTYCSNSYFKVSSAAFDFAIRNKKTVTGQIKTVTGFLHFEILNSKMAAEEEKIKLPHISRLKWRVDVCISSSSLKRVMEPSILLQLTTSDGQIRTFRVDLDQFHALRYTIAKALQKIQQVEQHPILNLTPH